MVLFLLLLTILLKVLLLHMFQNQVLKLITPKQILFLICFATFFSTAANSQQTNSFKVTDIDSVNIPDSLNKVYHYHDLAINYKATDLNLAIFYNKKALTLANQIKSPEACALTNELMGELFQKNNNLQPSINYYLISARIYENNNWLEELAGVYLKLGELYYNENFNLKKALSYYNMALDLAIKTNNKKLIADVYNKIAGVFFNQGSYEEALDFYLKSYDLCKNIRNKKGTARALNNIGEVYRIKGNYNKALNYYQRSLIINKNISDFHQIATNLENMGMVESANGNTKEAFSYYEKSLLIYDENKLPNDKIQILILIGKEYLNQNSPEKAYNYFIDAYQNAKEINELIWMSESSLGISNALESMEDFKNSLKYFKIHSQITDSLVNRQKADQLAIIRTSFLDDLNIKELKLKNNEIALLEKEKRINAINFKFTLFILLVIVTIAILIVVRQRMKAKKEQLIRHKNMELHKTQQELMQAEIKSKDNDLINFALHLVQKNQILQQLKKDLKLLSNNTDEETSKKLRELSLHVQQSLQIQQDIEEFQHKVDQTYSDFYAKLKEKYPSLTKNEERLCAMLRLNLSSKEIAAINNISLKAVEMGRYRLRKKCNIENSEILPKFLQNL